MLVAAWASWCRRRSCRSARLTIRARRPAGPGVSAISAMCASYAASSASASASCAGQELDRCNLVLAGPGGSQVLRTGSRVLQHLVQPRDSPRLSRHRGGNPTHVIKQRRPVAIRRIAMDPLGEPPGSQPSHHKTALPRVDTAPTLRDGERAAQPIKRRDPPAWLAAVGAIGAASTSAQRRSDAPREFGLMEAHKGSMPRAAADRPRMYGPSRGHQRRWEMGRSSSRRSARNDRDGGQCPLPPPGCATSAAQGGGRRGRAGGGRACRCGRRRRYGHRRCGRRRRVVAKPKASAAARFDVGRLWRSGRRANRE